MRLSIYKSSDYLIRISVVVLMARDSPQQVL